MKDYEKAKLLYSHALQLNPDLTVAKDNLSKLLKSKWKTTKKNWLAVKHNIIVVMTLFFGVCLQSHGPKN